MQGISVWSSHIHHAMLQKSKKNHKGQWMFYPYRAACDINLNRYNPPWMAMWRGNIDINAVLSKHVAINYISKYAAKAESKSECLDKIVLDMYECEIEEGPIF